MAKRSSRVRKPAKPAGQALVKLRSPAAKSSSRNRRGRPTAGKAKRVPKKEEVYVVEGICGIMRDKGQIWYQVKWQDWDPETNTWEPLENVKGVDELKTFESLAGHLESLPDLDPKTKGRKKKKQDTDAGKQDDGNYEVEQILGISWDFDNNRLDYLVKWLGWPSSSNSFEPEDNMNSEELLKPFETVADHLSRVWGSSVATQKSTASKSSSVSSRSKKSTPVKPGPSLVKKSSRKRPVKEEDEDEEEEAFEEQNGDIKDEDDVAENGTEVDENEEDEKVQEDEDELEAGDGPSPSKKTKAAAKKTPAKKAAGRRKKAPAKRR